jgi:hypothetical protein
MYGKCFIIISGSDFIISVCLQEVCIISCLERSLAFKASSRRGDWSTKLSKVWNGKSFKIRLMIWHYWNWMPNKGQLWNRNIQWGFCCIFIFVGVRCNHKILGRCMWLHFSLFYHLFTNFCKCTGSWAEVCRSWNFGFDSMDLKFRFRMYSVKGIYVWQKNLVESIICKLLFS